MERTYKTKQNGNSANGSWLKGKNRAVVDPTKNLSTSYWHAHILTKGYGIKKSGGEKCAGQR